MVWAGLCSFRALAIKWDIKIVWEKTGFPTLHWDQNPKVELQIRTPQSWRGRGRTKQCPVMTVPNKLVHGHMWSQTPLGESQKLLWDLCQKSELWNLRVTKVLPYLPKSFQWASHFLVLTSYCGFSRGVTWHQISLCTVACWCPIRLAIYSIIKLSLTFLHLHYSTFKRLSRKEKILVARKAKTFSWAYCPHINAELYYWGGERKNIEICD